MRIHVLDLDGSLVQQKELLTLYRPAVFCCRNWGTRIRLACSFRRFRQFEAEHISWFDREADSQPVISLVGSGDFHHVSLALVRRLQTPINLLVLDNHPDWMRFVPFLHCGTWLYHAARLPQVVRVFHVGGNVDFDNYYQWMAPRSLLRSGKITVLPAIRRFKRGAWAEVPHRPLRIDPETPVTPKRAADLLEPFRAELARHPLYLSLDKDVMKASEAVVNWDSGHLTLAEVRVILSTFVDLAGGRLIGLDLVGDWSPVCVRGWLRHLMHWTMHPPLKIDPMKAMQCSEQVNLSLLGGLQSASRSCLPLLPIVRE